MILPSDPYELTALMMRRLDGAQGYLDSWDSYYGGDQPAAFLSPDAQAALNGQLSVMSINFCRLAVLSLVERLRVVGFRVDGAVDANVWASWERCGGDLMADTAHADAFVSGRSYVIAWADDLGDPLITAESARYCTTIIDPATRRVQAALKRWIDQPDPDQPNGVGHMTLFLPGRVITYTTEPDRPISGYPPPGAAWRVTESLPNPVGQVPVVPVLNWYGRRIVSAVEGESELSDVAPLVDAINKIAADAMVTSEAAARPRRWATGLELIEQRDADGNPVLDADGQPQYVNPFASDATRVWQAEPEGVKFGQFPQADLSSYESLMAALVEKVAAVTTLPGHYLGVGQDQPPSADGLRAAEASLVSRAIGKIRMLTPVWSRVAALEVAIRTGRNPDTVRAEPLWSDPSTRSPAQSADEAVKLHTLGVPTSVILSKVLGWSPAEVAQVQSAAVLDQLGTVGP
jgi:hypothetical protein